MPIFAFFVLFFFLELFLMVMIAIENGLGWGVFWIEVATALLGIALIQANREQTREILRQATGGAPVNLRFALLTSARVTISGILLILPGFITDGIAAALLILPKLHALLLWLMRAVSPRSQKKRSNPKARGRVIEGEVERDSKDSDDR